MAERALDPPTAVCSLGCVLYEMLTGEAPYTGRNPQAVLAKRLSEPVPHVRTGRDVPLALEQVVNRALARAPADRFRSAAELASALQADRPSRVRRPIVRPVALGLALLVLGL